jgi:hypothetical protein
MSPDSNSDPEVFDLVDDLSKPKRSRPYPVTELVVQLLQLAAYDISKYKRNTLTSYWITSRARDICDYIHDRIEASETDQSWDAFDDYVELVPFLEE